MEKQYKMPVDIYEMFVKHSAVETIIERLISLRFFLKKAIKLKIENELFRKKIWSDALKIYPEFKDILKLGNYKIEARYDDLEDAHFIIVEKHKGN
jgi:hypothetical protein